MGLFLAAILTVFVAAPFIEGLPNGRYLDALLVTVVLIAAVLAVGGRRRSLTAACVLAAPVVFGYWFQHNRTEGGFYSIFIVAFIVFLSFVIFRFLHFILRASRVDSEVLFAGISVYLLLGLLWAAAYGLTARLVPGSFSGLPSGVTRLQGFESLYFSLITLTTVGYGDIAPLSQPARMLAMMEALSGSLYMAVLVARLVSLHATATPSESTAEKPVGDGRP